MVSSTAHAFLGLAGWSIIPDLATAQILRLLNNVLFTYFNIPAPPPGTPAYVKRYRYTFSAVVLGYLTYNLIQGSRSMVPNFYQMLGVPPTVDETGLKNAFKQFAKKYHPDRPGVGPAGEELFIMVREMFEALKDPVVRFAYDRFGPDVLRWEQCSTIRDYLRHGLMQSSGYHIVVFIGLQFWSTIGEPSPISFWRYIIYAALFVSEMILLLSPSPTIAASSTFFWSSSDPMAVPSHRNILHTLYPQRIAYQHVLFLHQLFIFLSVALGRVAPHLFPEEPKVGQAVVERLKALAGVADRETSIMLHADLHSIHPIPSDPMLRASMPRMRPYSNPSMELIGKISKEMGNMIIEMNVEKELGPLRSAWEAALVRGREALGESASGIATTAGSKNFWEKDVNVETEVRGDENETHSEEVPEVPEPENEAHQAIDQDSMQSSLEASPGKLSSPRPSPPPGMLKRSTSSSRIDHSNLD